jgi:microcystin-dependent protein
MGEPFVGEIRMFGGTFPPQGWALCQGQTMSIAENDVLFQLIGTTYGGDGQSTFQLPDLQGRLPMHMGQGPGITQNYQIGEKAGVESVTLTTNTIPIHTHPMIASQALANVAQPTGNVMAQNNTIQNYIEDVTDANFNANAVGPVGGSQPHENLQPYLCITFIISLFGVFPTQS